jgi:hypothetical protein
VCLGWVPKTPMMLQRVHFTGMPFVAWWGARFPAAASATHPHAMYAMHGLRYVHCMCGESLTVRKRSEMSLQAPQPRPCDT